MEEILEEQAPETEAAPEVDLVRMTLDSGVSPMEVRYCQINSCYRKLPMAYRSFTYVNSITSGVLSPERYEMAADVTDAGLELARWNVLAAIKAVKRFELAGRKVEFVTARCPARLALEVDTFEWMKSILKEANFSEPEKICIEFPQSLLYGDLEKARLSILNFKLLKVRTMMSGCGEADCPVASLVKVPLDYVLLSQDLTHVCDSRTSGTAVVSLINFLRSLNIDVIADAVMTDNQIRVLNRADCVGYIPSPAFKGSVEHGPLRMRLDEAVFQRDEEVE